MVALVPLPPPRTTVPTLLAAVVKVMVGAVKMPLATFVRAAD